MRKLKRFIATTLIATSLGLGACSNGTTTDFGEEYKNPPVENPKGTIPEPEVTPEIEEPSVNPETPSTGVGTGSVGGVDQGREGGNGGKPVGVNGGSLEREA